MILIFRDIILYVVQEVEVGNLSSESPYLGKSCQKRNITFPLQTESMGAQDQQQPASVDLTETDCPRELDMSRHAQLRGKKVQGCCVYIHIILKGLNRFIK